MVTTAFLPSSEATAAPPLRNSGIPTLLVVRELGLGGIERDVAKLALRFDRSRYVPYVATYQPFGPRFDELSAAGIPILPLKFPSLLSLEALSAAFQLRTFIRRHRIQIVHAFDPSCVFAVPLARLFRVPVVLSSQLGHRSLHDSRTRKQLRSVDRWSDAIVVNCDFLRHHLIQDYRTSASRVELCYNGIETNEFYPPPAALRDRSALPDQLSNAPLVIGAIAVLRPEKALPELLHAFAKVRNLAPGSKLLIVGSGPELSTLEATRLSLQLDNCVLLPAVKSVAPLLRGIDIFVSCSHSEAFSNAILEAMACGCAVIGSRVGGTPELIHDQENGLLFEPANIHDLAKKLARLLCDSTLRSQLSSEAARHARTRLPIEQNVARAMDIYDQLLRRKGLRPAT